LGGWRMKENQRPLKVSNDFRNFIENLGANRVKVGTEKRTLPLCKLPDVLVKYFKLNNDRYLELCKLEASNGTK